MLRDASESKIVLSRLHVGVSLSSSSTVMVYPVVVNFLGKGTFPTMKAATHEPLDNEQKAFHVRLLQAVEQINKADDLLTKNRGVDVGLSHAATALLLSAIAKIYVVETAEKYNMATRLTAFKK
jgi:hypothetical protein